MKKRNRKVITEQNRKINQKKQRKEFLQKLYHLIEKIGGVGVLSLINKKELDFMLESAYRVVRVEINVPDDVKDRAGIRKRLNKNILVTLRNTFFTRPYNGEKVTLYDILTLDSSLYAIFTIMKKHSFQNSEEFLNRMKPFTDCSESMMHKFWDAVTLAFHDVYLDNNSIKKGFWELKFSFECTEHGEIYMYVNIEAKYSFPHSKKIELDGHVRPIYPVRWCIPRQDTWQARIKPAELGCCGTFSQLPLDVYIQSHALNRMEERLDTFSNGMREIFLYIAFNDPKFICIGKNRYLVEYSIGGKKLGYLLSSIENGIFLIRTFLLLTNSGTPEGDRLQKQIGLEKLDKKYLAIDKLSTFLDSDIGENETLRKIFEDVGCSSLLDLKSENTEDCEEHVCQADFILKYLGKKKCSTLFGNDMLAENTA